MLQFQATSLHDIAGNGHCSNVITSGANVYGVANVNCLLLVHLLCYIMMLF